MESQVSEVILQTFEPPFACITVTTAHPRELNVLLKMIHFVVYCGKGMTADLAGMEKPRGNTHNVKRLNLASIFIRL